VSNRSLKQAKKALKQLRQPPAKKANKKALSRPMPVSPEPTNNHPLLPSPPEPFEEVKQIVQEAWWKVVFPSLRFLLLVELIGAFPSMESPLVAAPHKASHQELPALMH
jgi:hypothetical protein